MKNKDLENFLKSYNEGFIFKMEKKYTLNFDHLIKWKWIKQKSDRREIYFRTEHN